MFTNELPADEILDLLDKYIAEEYGIYENEGWTVSNEEGMISASDVWMTQFQKCRFRFLSDEEI